MLRPYVPRTFTQRSYENPRIRHLAGVCMWPYKTSCPRSHVRNLSFLRFISSMSFLTETVLQPTMSDLCIFSLADFTPTLNQVENIRAAPGFSYPVSHFCERNTGDWRPCAKRSVGYGGCKQNGLSTHPSTSSFSAINRWGPWTCSRIPMIPYSTHPTPSHHSWTDSLTLIFCKIPNNEFWEV